MVSPFYLGFPAQLISDWRYLVKFEMAPNKEGSAHDYLLDQCNHFTLAGIIHSWTIALSAGILDIVIKR